MSVINQIPPFNLNPVLITLQRVQYRFSRNRDDVLSEFDSDIQSVDNNIERVNQNIKDAKRGRELSISQIVDTGAGTAGCSVADKNERNKNVIRSLEDRKTELEQQKSSLETSREENRNFYQKILDSLVGIISRLFELLKELIEIIAEAISSIETVILNLSVIPLGAGLAGVATLNFILQLLQTKIFEPVSDTVDQQEVYNTEAPSV